MYLTYKRVNITSSAHFKLTQVNMYGFFSFSLDYNLISRFTNNTFALLIENDAINA